MKRRLFIAIIPPEAAMGEIEKAVAAVKSRLKQPVEFEPRENWHVTLVYLGEQDEEIIPNIRESMEASLGSFDYKPLATTDIVFAPPFHEPRMIWLTLSENASQYLAEFRAELVNELKKHGVRWEDDVRAYRGHITLAKFEPKTVEELGTLKWVCANRCDAYAIELMASNAQDNGPKYTSIVRMAQE